MVLTTLLTTDSRRTGLCKIIKSSTFSMLILLLIGSRLPPIKDPDYPRQFSLHNTGQNGGISGEDINFEAGRQYEITGAQKIINVIDSGCIQHEELYYDWGTSWNYLTNTTDASPETGSPRAARGTSIAGLAAARADDKCSVGVAYVGTISCTNLYNSKYSEEHFYDSLERNNSNIDVKVFGSPFACPNTCEYQKRDRKLEEIMNHAPDTGPLFVASAGQDAAQHGDANMFSVLRSPRMIVVADLTNRGAKSAWSNEGANVLVSAVVGGDSSNSELLSPTIPGLGISKEGDCGSDIDPRGAGAGIIAGLIGIVLKQAEVLNLELGWRDVHGLLIGSAVKNDPNHHSWISRPKARLGGEYSVAYGFGRVDMVILLEMTMRWTPLPPQVAVNVSKSGPFEVPFFRGGSVEILFDVDGEDSIVFVEDVVVRLELDSDDLSWVRISLVSPSGTKIPIKRYSQGSQKSQKLDLEFLARGFYSEPGTGTWKLLIGSDTVYSVTSVRNASLTIYGTRTAPDVFTIPKKAGANSYQPKTYTKPITVNVDTSVVTCGTTVNITVSGFTEETANLYLGDGARKSRWFYGVIAKGSTPLFVPCLFENNTTIHFIVETDTAGGETTVELQNTYQETGLAMPLPYQSFKKLPTESASIEILPALFAETWPDGNTNQLATVRIFNPKTSQIVHQETVDLRNRIIVNYNGSNCNQCILSLTPHWANISGEECREMFQPVSIGEDPYGGKWPIDLSPACPIPAGIVTPIPSPTPGPTATKDIPKRQAAVAIGVGTLFFAAFGAFVVIFMFCNRIRSHGIDRSPLNCYQVGGHYPKHI